MSYKFIGCVPVNLGNWRATPWNPETEMLSGTDRGNKWTEVYFHEATFNWGWLPPNCYGKFTMEMKNTDRQSGFDGKAIEYQLAWVKDPTTIKQNRASGEHFIHLEGAYFKEEAFKPWELYESDYFPLPDYEGPILLYLMVRGEENTKPAVAMWTLALFEKVEK